jgi:hypothetical protein
MEDDNILYSASFIDVPSRTAIGVSLGILLTVIVIVIFVIIFKLLFQTTAPPVCTAAPNNPAKVTAQATSATSFNVSWTPVDNVNGYTLYIGTQNGFTPSQAIFTRTTTIPTTTVNNLALNTTYYMFVTANNSCGTSAQSVQLTFLFKFP